MASPLLCGMKSRRYWKQLPENAFCEGTICIRSFKNRAKIEQDLDWVIVFQPLIFAWLSCIQTKKVYGIIVQNNPINYIDPSGLDYVLYQRGQLTWVFESDPDTGPDMFGTIYEIGRKSWAASSGSSEFGAIPKGTYFTSSGDKEFHPGSERAWGPFSYRLHESILTRLFNRLLKRTGGFHIHGGTEPGTAGCIEFEDYSSEQKSLHEFDKMMQDYGRRIKVYVE
jgi:hypothetical protein